MVLSDGGGQGEKENVVVGGQEEHIKEGARKQCRIETVGREEELKDGYHFSFMGQSWFTVEPLTSHESTVYYMLIGQSI